MSDVAEAEGAARFGKHQDNKLNVEPRRCSSCGNRFTPTVKRRRLCAHCYSQGDDRQDYGMAL